jgi:S1-C subfamily serine protease
VEINKETKGSTTSFILKEDQVMSIKYMLFVTVAIISVAIVNYCMADTNQNVNPKIHLTASKQKEVIKAEDKCQKQDIGVNIGTVTGILYADDRPLAVIDGVILREGQSIHNVKVVKISPDSVEFEYDGARWSQKVNEPLLTQYTSMVDTRILPKYPSVEDIVQYVSPAVVTIVVYDDTGEELGFGSGFFISDGKILTNAHVIEGAYSAKVHSLRKTYEFVTIAKRDELWDLALLSVQSFGEPNISLVDNGGLRAGQRVLAIGNPEGLDRTVSDGLISAIRDEDIQFTAPVSHGSSGGPLLNMQGQVIGITYAIYEEGQNLNLAIGIETIKRFLKIPNRPEKLKKAGSYIPGKIVRNRIKNIIIGLVALIVLFYLLKGLKRLMVALLRGKKLHNVVEVVGPYQPVILSSRKEDRHWRGL